MRTTCWLGACLGLLAAAHNARAQSADSWGQASIVLPKVQAWSGPNQEKNYPTNELTQGAKVVVEVDSAGRPRILEDINPKHPGWIKIKPPQGSFSWIHQRFITPANADAKTWLVRSENPVGIYVGSQVVQDEPKVERVQLPKGTQVIVLAAPKGDKQGGYYYPIQSPDTEPRFIPANAINKTQITRVSPATPGPGGTVAQVSNTVPAAGKFAELFGNADACQRAGRIADAKAYFELAKKATNNPSDQRQCDLRISKLQPDAGGWQLPGGPNRTVTGTKALYTANAPKVRELVIGQRQWSEWGTLEKSGLPPIDGQEVFRLTVNGQAYAYVTAQPGYTLSSYVGRYLTLYGSVAAWPDPAVRVPRVSVQHVSIR